MTQGSAHTVWVIRNAPLVFRYEQVGRALFEIAGRSISGLIRSNGIGDLYRIWLTSLRDGFDFQPGVDPLRLRRRSRRRPSIRST